MDAGALGIEHSHHNYGFWGYTQPDGRLALNVKSVHGNELIPQDLRDSGLRIDDKFRLSKEVDAIQLDIHETVRRKKLERFTASNIEQLLAGMRLNIKAAFLSATTKEAHNKWKLK